MYSSKDLELRDICPLELGYPKYKPEVAESVFVARKQRPFLNDEHRKHFPTFLPHYPHEGRATVI